MTSSAHHYLSSFYHSRSKFSSRHNLKCSQFNMSQTSSTHRKQDTIDLYYLDSSSFSLTFIFQKCPLAFYSLNQNVSCAIINKQNMFFNTSPSLYFVCVCVCVNVLWFGGASNSQLYVKYVCLIKLCMFVCLLCWCELAIVLGLWMHTAESVNLSATQQQHLICTAVTCVCVCVISGIGILTVFHIRGGETSERYCKRSTSCPICKTLFSSLCRVHAHTHTHRFPDKQNLLSISFLSFSVYPLAVAPQSLLVLPFFNKQRFAVEGRK